MKKVILLAAALATTSAWAQPSGGATGYSVTTDFTYASEYIFRGIENAGNSFQPSVEVAVGDFSVGLWTNQPVTNSEANEIDIYSGYTIRVSESLSLEALVNYYWYPEANPGDTEDSLEFGVGATWAFRGFSPNVYYYRDFTLNADTVQGALGYSFPLERFGVSLDTSVYVGSVLARNLAPDAFGSGPRIRESYMYYGVDVNVPYRLTSAATLTLGVHYSDVNNLEGVGGVTGYRGDKNVWFTAGLSVGF